MIRDINIGINLTGSELVSHTSLIVRARSISHRVPPTGVEQRRVVSKRSLLPQFAYIRATHDVAMARNSGWGNQINGQYM